ncbi:uncharacterized protein L201_006265 [Kwoniella dendrophila CBS 6074]|uniref:Protein CPL1-like domain-containing protein n=1 Tax=Kwoniella dendrophila CBS 6074 TaxID=1295534 RepID=A0AAX4K185_9TREE
MYFATILPSLLLVILPLSVSSSPDPDPTPTEPSELDIRGYDYGHHQPKCYDFETRDPDTCKCYPEFDEPDSHYGGWGNNGHWKKQENSQVEAQHKGKGNEPHYEECVCPDYPNTKLKHSNGYYGGGYDSYQNGQWKRNGDYGHSKPKCVCKGEHQTYNPHTRKCECDEGYEPWNPNSHYKRGGKHGGGGHPDKLICKAPPTGSAVPGYKKKRSPSLHQAIKTREQDKRSLENLLGCKKDEEACESSGTWTCLTTNSLLWSCGGCPGQGIDCGAIPGVSEVKCENGLCLIESCQRGWTQIDEFNSEYNTSTTCISDTQKPFNKPWFVTQGN